MNAAASIDEKPHRKDTAMNLARSFQAWRQYRNTAAELNRLSQRELADHRPSVGSLIGIYFGVSSRAASTLTTPLPDPPGGAFPFRRDGAHPAPADPTPGG